MAPNSIPNRQHKKRPSRMVQPALPQLPGLKPQKAKAAAVEPKTEAVDTKSVPKPRDEGEVGQTNAETVVEEVEPENIQDGSPGDFKTASTGAQPITAQESHAGEESSTAQPYLDGVKVGSGPDIIVKRQDEPSHVGVEEHLQIANKDPAVPMTEKSAVGTSLAQLNATSEEGRLPEGDAGSSEEKDEGEPRRDESATSEAPSSAQNEPSTTTTTPAYVNGNGSALASSNEGDVSLPELGHTRHGFAAARAGPTTEEIRQTTLNGYHQPSIAPVPVAASGAVPRSFNALPTLAEHLLLLSTTKEGADVLIEVRANGAQIFVTYAHSVILLRSLRMRRLITRQHQANNYGSSAITLYPPRFVMAHAFEAAMRFLYSDTVLGKDFFGQPHSGADFQTVRIHNLDYLLSYWVSGIELGLEPVSLCAERLLNDFLDWDILEITYKYAMELASPPMSSHAKNMTGSDYVVANSTVVKLILQFLAHHVDIKNFKLDTSSNVSSIPSRLPQLDDGRPKHNPALASMVFGSMPSSADMSPSSPHSEILAAPSTFHDTVASNILLNVDFENLFAFSNFIQAPTIRDAATTKLMNDIVNEREARRQKIHSSRIPNKERMADSAAWEAVGIKESILDTNVLHRDRVGFLVSSQRT